MKFQEYVKEKDDNKDIKEKLLDFIINNPYPKDKDFHAFAEENGMEPDVLESEAYAIISTFLIGNFAKEKKFTEKDADPKELEIGIEVEMEHLDDKSPYAKPLSKRIALDHLAELPDYYTKLKKMEGEHE